jgi:hypothetical protein
VPLAGRSVASLGTRTAAYALLCAQGRNASCRAATPEAPQHSQLGTLLPRKLPLVAETSWKLPSLAETSVETSARRRKFGANFRSSPNLPPVAETSGSVDTSSLERHHLPRVLTHALTRVRAGDIGAVQQALAPLPARLLVQRQPVQSRRDRMGRSGARRLRCVLPRVACCVVRCVVFGVVFGVVWGVVWGVVLRGGVGRGVWCGAWCVVWRVVCGVVWRADASGRRIMGLRFGMQGDLRTRWAWLGLAWLGIPLLRFVFAGRIAWYRIVRVSSGEQFARCMLHAASDFMLHVDATRCIACHCFHAAVQVSGTRCSSLTTSMS